MTFKFSLFNLSYKASIFVPYAIPIEIEQGLSNPIKLSHKNFLKSSGYFDFAAIISISS